MGKNSGFTLIEILIVVAIIGAISSIAVFKYHDGAAAYVVKAAGEKLRQELLITKAEALARNRFVDLALTGPETFQMRLLQADGHTVDSNLSRRPLEITQHNQLIEIIFSGFQGNRVIFDPKGRITNITDNYAGKIIIRGKQDYEINLFAATGYLGR